MRDLTNIIASNARHQPGPRIEIPVSTLTQLVDALKTARASLNDVLVHGAQRQQRRNINNVDLPAIVRAITAGEGALRRPTWRKLAETGEFVVTPEGGTPVDLGPGSLYVEERAQARFDSILRAREAARAEEERQEIEDERPPSPFVVPCAFYAQDREEFGDLTLSYVQKRVARWVARDGVKRTEFVTGSRTSEELRQNLLAFGRGHEARDVHFETKLGSGAGRVAQVWLLVRGSADRAILKVTYDNGHETVTGLSRRSAEDLALYLEAFVL